jgi:hypothetical protein
MLRTPQQEDQHSAIYQFKTLSDMGATGLVALLVTGFVITHAPPFQSNLVSWPKGIVTDESIFSDG